MSDVFDVSPNNSYLTTKQWEEVVEYVKNRKNSVEEPVVEESESMKEATEESVDVQNSYAYNKLIQATSVSDMYEILLTIMNDEPDKLYEMSSDELQALYNTATKMNEENPSDDYQDLIDTLQYLAGDYDLNDAVTLADVVWSGNITAQTLTGTQTIQLSGTTTHWVTGTIVIGTNADITIIGSGLIRRGSELVDEIFDIYSTAKLTIIGDSDTSRIDIYGHADKNLDTNDHATQDKTMIRCDNYLYLENVNLYGNSCAIVRDYSDTTTTNSDDTYAGGAITLLDGNNNVTIKNCTIYDNTAQNGAGIYLCRTGSGTLTIEDTVFDNCDATGSGGAIYFDGRPSTDETVPTNGYLNYTVKITNTIIQNCESAGCGSAIYMHNRGKADITMEGCTVQNCISNSSSCGTLRCDGNSRYKLTVDDCLIQNNQSVGGHGAGIYWNALGEGASLVVKNSRILNNEASSQGGGVFVEGSSITITNTTISGNKANLGGGIGIKTFADSSITVADGVTGTSFNLELGEGVVIENNVATSKGGGISYYIVDGIPESGFTFNYINNGAIIRNNVVSSEGVLTGIPSGVGGGIAIIDETNVDTYYANTYMKNGTIAGNKAIDGGGFHVTTGDFEMSGGTIENNVVSGNGSGIYVVGGNFTMTDGVFGNNTAEVSGGAVYVSDGDVSIESGTIADNIALDKGGAIAVTSGNVTIGTEECYNAGESSTHIHPVIENNIASDGGGIYVDGGATTMWCGDIKHNHTYDKTVNVLVVSGGNFTYNGGSIGIPFDSGIFVNGGIFSDNTDDSEEVIKHELHYNSVLSDMKYNGGIPESKWIASPRGDVLNIEDCDTSSPLWSELFPDYEFVGWEQGETSEETNILNAIWEKR